MCSCFVRIKILKKLFVISLLIKQEACSADFWFVLIKSTVWKQPHKVNIELWSDQFIPNSWGNQTWPGLSASACSYTANRDSESMISNSAESYSQCSQTYVLLEKLKAQVLACTVCWLQTEHSVSVSGVRNHKLAETWLLQPSISVSNYSHICAVKSLEDLCLPGDTAEHCWLVFCTLWAEPLTNKRDISWQAMENVILAREATCCNTSVSTLLPTPRICITYCMYSVKI